MKKDAVVAVLIVKNWVVYPTEGKGVTATKTYKGKGFTRSCMIELDDTHAHLTVDDISHGEKKHFRDYYFRALYRDLFLTRNQRGTWVIAGFKKLENDA